MRMIAACLFAGALAIWAAPASAHFAHPPRCIETAPGLVLKMNHYQQPDGSYDRLSDLVEDINGTPCGLDCPAPARLILVSPPSYYCAPRGRLERNPF